MTRNTTIRRRAAFTLVELMVSAAVIVLIMAILTQAFVISTDTMRQLKATGDMVEQLRAAGIVLRDDLAQNHFSADDNRENLGLKVSDQRLDRISGVGATITGWSPPAGGFFRARSSPSFVEGYDNDNVGSYRADGTFNVSGGPGVGHYLHFTSVRPGGRDQDVYSATTATGTVTSRAAEIAYFLDPNQQGVTGAGGLPYYNLIRRQRLVAMTGFDAPNFQTNDRAVVSVYSAAGVPQVNTMASITDPRNRLGGGGTQLNPHPRANGTDSDLSASSTRLGDDVLLSHVLSFEVKLQWTPATIGVPGTFMPRAPRAIVDPTNVDTSRQAATAGGFDTEPVTGTGPGTGSTDFPLDNLPRVSTNNNFDNHFVFDTWSTAVPGWDVNRQATLPGLPAPPAATGAIPMRVRVVKAKITIRVWDPKLKLSRQMTVVQDL